MLSWSIGFFIIAVISAVYGFSNIDPAGAPEIARIIFVVSVVLFMFSLLAELFRRP